MDLGPIHIMKITLFFQKLIIIKILELIKYKITDLKLSQPPTGILKNCKSIIEEQEQIPD
jgi:hypothetical protein